jgi:predicted nucleic acid-binding protein
MENQNKAIKPQRYLILDSNIFKYFGNLELSSQIIFLLQDALAKGYGLAISKFTLLELLDTATVDNEIKAFSYIKGLRHFRISETVLTTAGHLGCLYKDDGIEDQPEKGDKIIAGTAWANNAVIFTANGRDFPTPFFNVLSKSVLKYTKNKAEVHMVFYFVEPDYQMIQTKYQERVDEHKRKTVQPSV